jgi:hypothetical protein
VNIDPFNGRDIRAVPSTEIKTAAKMLRRIADNIEAELDMRVGTDEDVAYGFTICGVMYGYATIGEAVDAAVAHYKDDDARHYVQRIYQ